MQPQQRISSPATSSIPLEEPKELKVGQEIAFIYNREDCVSGTLKAINPDGTYDLLANVPQIGSQIKWMGTPGNSDYKKVTTAKLIPRSFLRARLGNPCAIVIKEVQKLAEPIIDASRQHRQESTSMWIDSGQRHRIPRFHEFYAPLVGTFFDPSSFYYKIVCWRASFEIKGDVFPEETRIFPSPEKKPFFTNFAKCFDRYFKEYHQSLGKWNRVRIIAIHPDDVQGVDINKEGEIKVENANI